jgi:fatty-acyl-CoA synthase
MTFVESIGAWWYHSHYVHRILAALIKDTGRTVLIRGGIRLTGGMLAKSILADASLLRRNGIGHGSVVAILTQPNHPIMLTVRYAAHLLGATTVCIRSDNARSDDRMLAADDQARMLAETGACLLVADSASAERARVVPEPGV